MAPYHDSVNARTLGLAVALLSLLGGLWLVLMKPTVDASGRGAAALGGAEQAAGPRQTAELSRAAAPAAEAPGEAATGTRAAAAGNLGRTAVLLEGAGLRFVGQVLAAEDQQPIPGAEVRLRSADLEVRGSSDAGGRFALLWTGGPLADIELSHPEFDRLALADFDGQREAPFLLKRCGGLEGEVHWNGSGDSSGLLVEIWPLGRGTELGQAVASERTGERGAFLFEHLQSGEYVVSARADDELRGPTPLAVRAGVRVQAGQRQALRLELDPGAVLEVEVVQQGAGPLAGLFVRAEFAGAGVDKNSLLRREGLTATNGRTTLKGLPEGMVALLVIGPHGEHLNRMVGLQAKGHFERVEVPAPARIEGRVLDSNRQPVAGALVGLSLRQQGGALRLDRLQELTRELDAPRTQTTTSAADGGFRFEAVPARSQLWLVAYPPELIDGSTPTQRFPGTLPIGDLDPGSERRGFEVVLFGVRSVSGQVRLEDGTPLAGVEVRAEGEQNGSPQRSEPVLTDSTGAFALPAVRDRNARIIVELEGYRTQRQALPDGSNAVTDLRFVLLPKSPLMGRVVDGQGQAVAGARLSLRRERERRNDNTRSDAFGRFQFDDGPSGRWDLRVEADGFRELVTNLELPLSTPQLLRLEPQQELPKARLFGECLAGWSSDPVVGFTLGGLGQASLELRGGRFYATGVEPGRLRLFASAVGCESLQLTNIEVPPGGNIDLGTLRLFPPATLRLKVTGQFQARTLRARLEPLPRESGGVGSERPPVSMRGNELQAAQGTWRLVVEAEGMATHSEQIVLERSSQQHEVRLEPTPQ